mmetsp:Transcript_12450/g.45394  ORF Transcript_12450/g.45394 Transcript_12450/m.45394 type:complete len:528 (-) Transcript_12450:2617-4200(-)
MGTVSVEGQQLEAPLRYLVVDANAIIRGVERGQLHTLGEHLVTLEEVKEEIRDERSRQALQQLPFGIECKQPSDSSLRKVSYFARATGDLHALSEVDIKVLALAVTLEEEENGAHHLRDAPPQLAVKKMQRSSKPDASLPGWGVENVADPDSWAEVDASNEAEEAALRALLQGSQADDADHQDDYQTELAGHAQAHVGADGGQDENADAGVEESGSPANAQQQGRPGPQLSSQRQQPQGSSQVARGVAGMNPFRTAPLANDGQNDSLDEADEGGEGDEGDGWETARSRTARNKAWKKEARRAREEAELAAAMKESMQLQDTGGARDGGADDEEAPDQPMPEFTSNVGVITFDFAMQNVALQMGLRLLTAGGLHVKEVCRYVLKCQACNFVMKTGGKRMFCERCGKAAIFRARISYGPDGRIQYGERKRHNLRGTRFSLPAPKGGREGSAKNPLLAEDELMMRKHILRQHQKKKDKVDPFVPEYNDSTWHSSHNVTMPKGDVGGLDRRIGSGATRRNPNERWQPKRRR